ncbi:MAG TPA: spore photoproduct lyase [Firmicutes bacterium]|nr:spore photoproduct lyase [Candidatus Fermentithermobacillaceae bacterium]
MLMPSTGRFVPRRAYIEEAALSYPLGRYIVERLKDLGVPAQVLKRGERPKVPGKNPTQVYEEAKRTLVVRVRKDRDFATCKPSAHYQLPLVSSCPGLCEYCYLQTTLGPRPYVRVYANIEEILATAKSLVQTRLPQETVFEGSATSDPLAIEHLTGSLAKAIEFFSGLEGSRFRFVTKFSGVEPILGLSHGRRTTARVSVNADYVIRTFEHNTSPLEERLRALSLLRGAGYPVGVMIGPVITFDGWEDGYRDLMERLRTALQCEPSLASGVQAVPFELITHRFTGSAKKNILSVFPGTKLPLDENDRKVKFGQFGYTKYVYPEEKMDAIREFFRKEIDRIPGAYVHYLV